MIPALMTLSGTGMPAFLMATTKGEAPVPLPPLVKSGSFEGQITPIARTEEM